MRRPSSLLASVAAIAAVLGAAACSGSSGGTPATPHAQLVAGISSLSGVSALTTTARLDSTPGALRAVFASGGTPLTAVQASAIATTQVVIENRSQNQKTVSFDVQAQNAGKTLLELRSINNTLYIQGDVPAALALINQEKALKEVQARAASLPAFVQAFASGKWVSLGSNVVSAITSVLGSSAGGAATGTSGPRLLADLKTALDRDVTATTKLGTDSSGDHLQLTSNSRALATDFAQAAANDIPGGSALTSKLQPGTVPSQQVTIEAWVKDGALSKLSVDVVQFFPKSEVKPGQTLPLVITFERSGGDISAPSGATPVDLTKLSALIGALGLGV